MIFGLSRDEIVEASRRQRKRDAEWNDFFAIIPRQLKDCRFAWFHTIQRRRNPMFVTFFEWEYREKEPK